MSGQSCFIGFDDVALVLSLAGQWAVVDDQPQPADGGARGAGPRGYATGKKVKGRKRHILTDTKGNFVHSVAHTAEIKDRSGRRWCLPQSSTVFPRLRHVFADGGYAGTKLKDALRWIGKWAVAIVKRSDTAKGFEVLPRRLSIERILEWTS